MADKQEQGALPELSARVTQCEDGKYRWVYEMSLYKNPTIYFLVWKIFFFLLLAIFAVIFLADGIRYGRTEPAKLIEDLKFFGYFFAGMTALTGLGYLIYAAVMGGKYVVSFEMDEKGVKHIQSPAQAQKAKKLGKAARIAGYASGRFGAAAGGVAAQQTEVYSDFARVKKVKSVPFVHTIKLNAPFCHNQVYAVQEDYDFVLDYIVEHCPNLGVKATKENQ